MSDLMICHYFFLLIRKHCILFLISCNNHFNTFFQIRFCDYFPVVTYSTKSCFVYNIGKFCTRCTCCHSCNSVEIHIIRKLNFLRMNFQNRCTSFQIRKFYRNTSVKTSRTSQRRVKRFRSIGGCKDDYSVISLKTIHLCKKLIQCLFTFIISTCHLPITFLADGINLINKYNTWGLFLGLFKKIPNLGCTHTYKHLHEFRTGHGEERYVGLTGNSLGKHGFTCTWRPYKKNTFGHRCTNFCIFLRIMKIVYNFLQIFFCLFFTCYIIKANSLCRLYINLGIALAHTKSHRVFAPGLFHHFFTHILSQCNKDYQRKYSCKKET